MIESEHDDFANFVISSVLGHHAPMPKCIGEWKVDIKFCVLAGVKAIHSSECGVN